MYPGDVLCILVTPQPVCQEEVCPRGGIRHGPACLSHGLPLSPPSPAATPVIDQGTTRTRSGNVVLGAIVIRIPRAESASAGFRCEPWSLGQGGRIGIASSPVTPIDFSARHHVRLCRRAR